MSNTSASDLAKAAQLLSELQKQLIRYKTALDSIDGASTATQHVALEVEKLSHIIQELGESQAELAKNFEDTRRALLFTQQKTQQVSRDLDDMSQHFSGNVQQSLQRTIQTVDEKVAQFVAPDRNVLHQEVRKLKFFLFLNIIIMFILFFSAFMYLNRSGAGAASTANGTVRMQVPDRRAEAMTSSQTLDAPRIQVLNGCGVEGVAKNFVSYLENAKFIVNNIENADNFNYERTVIFLSGDHRDPAVRIAGLFGISLDQIKAAGNKWQGYQITVVLGRDYLNLIPSKN